MELDYVEVEFSAMCYLSLRHSSTIHIATIVDSHSTPVKL